MCLKCNYISKYKGDLDRHCARLRQCTPNQAGWPVDKPAQYTAVFTDQSGTNIYRLDCSNNMSPVTTIRDMIRTEIAQMTTHQARFIQLKVQDE